MKPLTVATTLNPRFDHVTSIESVRGNVLVTHRCDDLPELISLARSGLVDLVLVAGDTEDVGRNALESIRTQSARPPALAVLSDVATERDRLESLGIAANTPDIEPEQLVSWLAQVAREHHEREQSDAAGPGNVSSGVRADGDAEPWTVDGDDEAATDPDTQVATTERARERPGKIIAVWGPIGSPGRTTIAVNLAAELGLAGEDVVLIDADTYGASAAAMLGLLDDAAGIAQACRAAERADISGSRLKALAAPIRVAGTRIDVLTGLTRPDRWPELRASSLAQVLRRSTEHWSHVVVDCGFGLEEDEELSFDVPAPQRNGATLTALAAADHVLAVGTGDPVGLPRLIKGLDELERVMGAESHGRISPVINKMSASTSGVSPRAQIRVVWSRYGSRHEIHSFLPLDTKAVSHALFGGQVLAESAPKSSLRSALSALAQRTRGDAEDIEATEARTGATPATSETEESTPRQRRRAARATSNPVSRMVSRFSRTKQG